MTIGYEHLKQKDRIQIQTLWEIGFPKRKIARDEVHPFFKPKGHKVKRVFLPQD